MKWLLVTLMLLPALAVSRSPDFLLSSAPVLSESALEQQRGGFYSSGKRFSIGLTMKVWVNGRKVFYSNLHSLLNDGANQEIIGLPQGVSITPVLGTGHVGVMIKNSADNIKTDAVIDIDVVTPYNIDTYKVNQGVSTRVRAATKRLGY